jgi:hypothetical protein
MMDFERESEIMEMKEEMMNDAIDDALEADEDEAESEEVVNKVLDELGLSMDETVRRGKFPSKWICCNECPSDVFFPIVFILISTGSTAVVWDQE